LVDDGIADELTGNIIEISNEEKRLGLTTVVHRIIREILTRHSKEIFFFL
jgi:hypothetical protein